MLRLGILGLGMVAAMVAFDCGGRTPLQDEDLFGAPGSINTTGGSGTTSSTGAGGTSVIIGGAGSGVAGTVSTGVGGGPGFGGNGSGTGGSVIVGTGGTTGFGGTGAAGSGFGGFAGAGGTVTGTGGTPGAGGAGGGTPAEVRRLVNELPGTRADADCIGCASTCPGSAQCAANAVCAAGITCAVANCGMQNRNPPLPCLSKCVGGDPQALGQALSALGCVYGTCQRQCVAGRMR